MTDFQPERAPASRSEDDALRAAMLEAALDCIITMDHRGLITEFNAAAVRTFGYSRDAAIGQSMAELLIPADLRQSHMRGLARVLAGGAPRVLGKRIELRALCADGHEIPVELTVVRVGPDATPTFVGHLRDISDRRAAEEHLREEVRMNETLQQISRSFTEERDPEALVQRITDESRKLLGAAYGAFFFNVQKEGEDAYLLFTLSGFPREVADKFPVPRATGLFAPTFRGEGAIRIDDVKRDARYGHMGGMPAGHPPVASYLAVPVKKRCGEVLGGLFFGHPERARFDARHERIAVALASHAAVAIENATLYRELKRSEEKARQAHVRVQEADRKKDEFLAVLGHELRNPLAPILTALEVLRLKGDDPKTRRERGIIGRQARHLVRLVDDLLDVSRVARGQVRLSRGPVSTNEVIAAALEMVSPQLEERAHRVEVDLRTEDLPLLVMSADRTRVEQILSNLLTNAARYTEPGGHILIRARRSGDAVELTVRDNGIGISADVLPKIFDLFAQGKRSVEYSRGGLGVGLALVRSLTELHGGSVTAHSDGPGLGTEFVVRLPAVGRGPEQSRSTPLGTLAPTGTRPRVLLVDDNVDAVALLADALNQLGYSVRTAKDGPRALSEATDFDPEIAVLDIGLPVMDGYELARRLRERGATDLRLVALTGYGQEHDAHRARDAGFDVHLVKPVDITALMTAMAN